MRARVVVGIVVVYKRGLVGNSGSQSVSLVEDIKSWKCRGRTRDSSSHAAAGVLSRAS